jgi:hypothetical protein
MVAYKIDDLVAKIGLVYVAPNGGFWHFGDSDY